MPWRIRHHQRFFVSCTYQIANLGESVTQSFCWPHGQTDKKIPAIHRQDVTYRNNYLGGDCVIFIQLEKLFLSESLGCFWSSYLLGGKCREKYETDAGSLEFLNKRPPSCFAKVLIRIMNLVSKYGLFGLNRFRSLHFIIRFPSRKFPQRPITLQNISLCYVNLADYKTENCCASHKG